MLGLTNSTVMEKLLKTAISAMGIDASVFIPQMEAFLQTVWNKLTDFDARLAQMERTNAKLAEQNEHYLALVHAAYPDAFKPVETEKEIKDGQPKLAA